MEADSSHINQMYEIEKSVFNLPWSYESLSEDVSGHEIAEYIVGISEGEVIAYGGFWHVLEESHITNIAVREDFRHMGVGLSIMEKLIEFAVGFGVKTMTLEVRESNAAAIGLYEKIGFKTVGRRRRYYPDNWEDALVMNMTL